MKQIEKFNPLKAEVAELVAPILRVRVVDAASGAKAIEAAKTIKEMEKRIETIRKSEVEPLNTQVKEINAYAKQVSQPLEQAETHLRTQLNAFAQEQERVRIEALRKAEEIKRQKEAELKAKQEAERASLEDMSDLFGVTPDDVAKIEERHVEERAIQSNEMSVLQHDAKNMNIKNTHKTYEVKVTDLNLIPKEFLIVTVNEKAVLAAHKAGVKLQGLEIVEKIEVKIGRNTRVPKAMLG